VSFPDPDDLLDPDYLSSVDRFLTLNPETAMVGTNRVFLIDENGEVRDSHPLRRLFQGPDQMVDLERFPDFFHGSAPAAFFRTDWIARTQLRFDIRIRPNFEDGHFCTRYLLEVEAPLVGFLGTARYLYRKRADGTSTLQTGLLNRDRFLAVPDFGYLDVLNNYPAPGAYAPEWVQNLVLYELSWYFSSDLALSGATAAHGEVADQFVDLLRRIVERLDPDVITSFGLRRLDPVWRDIMLHALTAQRWVTPYAVLDGLDEARQLIRISYRYVGDAPTETILVGGEPAEVIAGKTWTHEYFEHDLMHERVAWVRSDEPIRVLLDGKPVPLQPEWQDRTSTIVSPLQVRSWSDPELLARVPPKIRVPTRMVRWLARRWLVGWVFRDAWCLMDRIHNADDNGERLFRYLREQRRDINAWFVLERGTPDWKRLAADGYRSRMIAHGGVRWRLLMLNCAHLASSHVDAPVHRPPAIVRMSEPTWKFTFLQHGVIKDDLSRWLNPKRVDLFVTSTPQEQQSIAGDNTRYVYTSKEAQMTGLPRFDRLRELGAQVSPAQRDLILICPTWRYWLTPPLESGTQRRVLIDNFLDTDYARNWLGLLTDPALAQLAHDHHLRIGFLPHPNIQPALAQMTLPPHVQALTFEGQDVQQMIANAALMVTDYSSMAFNAAYLDRPVIYFQFDADLVNNGAHVGRPGYFDYTRDGFGPVTTTITDTTTEITTTITTNNRTPTPHYQHRINTTFTQRDGNCCQRTTHAIEKLTPPTPSLTRRALRRLARTPRVRTALENPRIGRLARSVAGRRSVE
jgi:hypothetical protein